MKSVTSHFPPLISHKTCLIWSGKFRLRFLLISLLAALAACSGEKPGGSPLQGYVEGEFAQIALSASGTLSRLHVQRGDQIAAGQPLFILDPTSEQAARREAAERLRSAQERLANLRSARRPPEIEAANAQAAQAAASIKLSNEQLRQQEQLYAAGFISKASLDQARSNHERDVARLREVQAQGQLVRLPVGREAEIRAAAAEVETARAALDQANWRLGQRTATAPVSAWVHDTFFVEGEWVPASRPVVSLLAPDHVKVRFFVPEPVLGSIKPGDLIDVSCDGCERTLQAAISFISKQAEFTPPVIYDKDTRAKLVFMVEARPSREDALMLRPGQPVDIRLSAPTAASAP